MEEQRALLATGNACRGWVTRQRAAIARLVDGVKDHPSRNAVKSLEERLEKLKQSSRKGIEAYGRAMEMEEEDDARTVISDRLTEMEEAADEAELMALAAIGSVEQALAPAAPAMAALAGMPAPGAGPPQPSTRMMDSLKPEMLSLEATPIDVTAWKERFGTYFRRSRVDTWTDVGDQHNVLFGCVTNDLATRIRSSSVYRPTRGVLCANPATGDSLMEIIDTVFLAEVPLFNRRLEFWSMKQESGQTVDQFVDLLEHRGREAEIAAMARDDMIIFRMLTGVTDEGLIKEWGRLDEPTLADLKRVQRTYLAARRQEKALSGTVSRAARVDSRRPAQPGSRGGQRSPSYQRIPTALRGKCLRCGNEGHFQARCPLKRDDVSCSRCKRQGHLRPACMQAHKGRSPTPARVRSTSGDDWQGDDGGGHDSDESDVASTMRAVAQQCAAGASRPTPQMTVQVDQGGPRHTITCTPDTGATRTVVAGSTARRLKFTTTPTSAKLFSAKSGETMESGRRCTFHAQPDGGNKVTIDALVSEDLHDSMLVSWHDLTAMGVLPEDFPNVARKVGAASNANDAAVHDKAADVERIRDSLLGEYKDVLCDKFPPGFITQGEPVQIAFRDDVQVRPHHVYTTRAIPIHMKEEADKLINDLLDRDIICRLDEHTTTEWLHRGHFVPKPSGGVRLVTDYSKMNRCIVRPVHPFPSPDVIFQSIEGGARWFAKLDALHGYFQIPLHKDSQPYTAFLLPQGRFMYRVAPMGLNPSGDWWCCRSDQALAGLPGVIKLVDDVLVQASSLCELEQRLAAVLQRCREHKLVLCRKKFVIGQTVPFAGHIVCSGGVRPDPDKLQALAEFPAPIDLTSLRGFLGMANQLGTYVPDLAHATEPLRALLRKGTAWTWTPEHQRAFERVKNLLTSGALVSFFRPELQSLILTDASKKGLGFVLLQEGSDGRRLVACGSRSLTPAESRYAPIELEALAVVFAIEKCQFYLQGSPKAFKVVTDHKPLVGLFQKPLAEVANPRLQRLRLRCVEANIDVTWQAGKLNIIADTLSRSPVFAPAQQDECVMGEASESIAQRIRETAGLSGLIAAAESDTKYQTLIKAVTSGVVPADHSVTQFRPSWDRLGVQDLDGSTLVMYDSTRIVVPASYRRAVLDSLHTAHSGLTKTLTAARQAYFWPNMSKEIEDKIRSCSACQEDRPAQRAAVPAPPPPVSLPMEEVNLDLFQYGGNSFLVVVDRFSGFPLVHPLRKNTTTEAVVKKLSEWFNVWGLPQVIRSDGGPQFSSAEFARFCANYDIAHELSSPYYPQSNGMAEAGVKNCKSLMKRCASTGEDLGTALHAFRNMPRADGVSPAQLMFGRRLRTQMPLAPQLYEWTNPSELYCQKRIGPSVGGSRLPRRFREGEKVLVQDPVKSKWPKRATVLGEHNRSYASKELPRSYIIKMEDGAVTRRNERLLRPVTAPPHQHDARETVLPPERRRSERLQRRVHFAPGV
jgi:transposase InsO family protein